MPAPSLFPSRSAWHRRSLYVLCERLLRHWWKLCRHGNRACMASVTRCTWVCPVCWTAGAWSAWSTWPWQMTRWRSCRTAPARCGTSRRTCRMFDCTVGGGSDPLLLLFLLASRFHSRPPHVLFIPWSSLVRYTQIKLLAQLWVQVVV